jgi:3-oxoacyl-[acyl-carrier protein] reductase
MGDSPVALVTGSSSGIGAQVVRRLAAENHRVVVNSVRSVSEGQALADELGTDVAHYVQGDVAVLDDAQRLVAETVKHFGRLDVLVNNAGIFPFGPIDDVSIEEVDRTLNIHARAAYLASQAAVRHMTEGGRIISIGSNLAERVPFPGVALYSMSKSALLGFTRGLARDLGERGITVNLVQPGSTDTEMNPADGPAADHQRAISALGRYADPTDIADTVAFLSGPGGRNITGSVFTVDGGTNA